MPGYSTFTQYRREEDEVLKLWSLVEQCQTSRKAKSLHSLCRSGVPGIFDKGVMKWQLILKPATPPPFLPPLVNFFFFQFILCWHTVQYKGKGSVHLSNKKNLAEWFPLQHLGPYCKVKLLLAAMLRGVSFQKERRKWYSIFCFTFKLLTEI